MEKSPSTYQPMLRVVLAVAGGILLDRLIDPSILIWVALIPAGFAIWLVSFRAKHLRASSIALLTTLLVFGAAWHNLHWNLIGARDISSFAELDSKPVMIRGTVAAQPKWIAPDPQQEKYSRPRGVRSRLLINVTSIRDRTRFRLASGNVELFVEGLVDQVHSGDPVQLAGNLSSISPVSNPGEFDLRRFFRGKRTLCWMNLNSADGLWKTGGGNVLSRTASSARVSLDSLLWKYLDKETAPLASAMLLGNRDQLDRVTRDQFLLSGTVHLLAISGLHVGILAGVLLLIPRLGFMSRRKGLLLTIVFVIAYAWLVEFRPPVTRAAILISVFCCCRWIGRKPFSFNSLALAGLVVLAINPIELFGPGAQLSFLAVGTLIFARHWIAPPKSNDPIDRLIEKSRSWQERTVQYFGLRMYMAFAVSAVIWLFAVPAVASQFHIVAPIALIANPLLLIPISIGLVCGLGVLLFGFWMPPVATLLAWSCEGSLGVIKWTVDACQNVPLGHWWTAGPPLMAVVGFYIVLLIVYLRFEGVKFRYVACGFLVWLVVGWLIPDWHYLSKAANRESLRCTVIDVGHGGCVLLQMPGGKNVLYDCGSFGSPRNAQRTAAAVLWHQRIKHLDAVIVSHADTDHFNGLPELARQFSIEQVVISHRLMRESKNNPMIKLLLDEMSQQGVWITSVQSGDTLDIANSVRLEVLNPPFSGFNSSDNANSIVMEVEFQGSRLLLPGDLEREGLDYLLSRNDRQYDVVMSPHHGSKNSRPLEFFSWCKPDYIITSCSRGKNNDLRSHIPDHIDGTIFHTGYDGAVQIEIEESNLAIRTWAENPWLDD